MNKKKIQQFKIDRRKNEFVDYSKLFKIEISNKRITIIRENFFNEQFDDKSNRNLNIFDEFDFSTNIIVKFETKLKIKINQQFDF